MNNRDELLPCPRCNESTRFTARAACFGRDGDYYHSIWAMSCDECRHTVTAPRMFGDDDNSLREAWNLHATALKSLLEKAEPNTARGEIEQMKAAVHDAQSRARPDDAKTIRRLYKLAVDLQSALSVRSDIKEPTEETLRRIYEAAFGGMDNMDAGQAAHGMAIAGRIWDAAHFSPSNLSETGSVVGDAQAVPDKVNWKDAYEMLADEIECRNSLGVYGSEFRECLLCGAMTEPGTDGSVEHKPSCKTITCIELATQEAK